MIEPRFYRPIVKAHLKPEQLAAPNIWGREIKLLKQLGTRYDDGAFWLAFGLGFKLNSFAWFKTPGGRVELEQHWRLWRMDRVAYATAQAQGCLNRLIEETSKSDKPAAAPKQSAVEWADTPVEPVSVALTL